jgi:hypothetical protein
MRGTHSRTSLGLRVADQDRGVHETPTGTALTLKSP